MKIMFGTWNRFKIQEFASILRPFDVDFDIIDKIPMPVEETGCSFKENALIKARYYSNYIKGYYNQSSKADFINLLKLQKTWILSEDSGLSIPSLGNLPGIYSARFSECEFSDGKLINHKLSLKSTKEIDKENNLKVLNMLRNTNLSRKASMEVYLAIVDLDQEIVFSTTHKVDGVILESPVGNNGFGYDPIFVSERSFNKSWAEIDPARKNIISPRRRVLSDFAKWIGIIKDSSLSTCL